jgi:hypothetical protein
MTKYLLTLFFTFTFCQTPTFAQEDSSGGDDLPSACSVLGSVELPNGQTIEEFQKKNPGTCDTQCKSQLQDSKAKQDRQSLAKSVKVVGGKQADDNPIAQRRIIDGPANLRDAPNGKMIGSFPDKFVVLIDGYKDDWFLIRGYWDRSCETGWTHKKNLRPYM